jgi:hypothetical protein
MTFSKSEDSQRERRELANDANKPKKIGEIRPFAFQISEFVKRL